jgi:glycosyltransferase involved in cell wall biosynthesis
MARISCDVLLVLAGEGEEEGALRARAAPYGERVRFVRSVRGEVAQFLSACDLLVFAPSPTEADRPRIIVMAQLVGLPVIATHPEGAEAVTSTGAGTVVSPHHDAAALASVIDAYCNDPERRRREGEIARRAALERHDPDRTLVAVEEALGLFA